MQNEDEELAFSPKHAQHLFGHESAERLFLEAFNSDRLHHA